MPAKSPGLYIPVERCTVEIPLYRGPLTSISDASFLLVMFNPVRDAQLANTSTFKPSFNV